MYKRKSAGKKDIVPVLAEDGMHEGSQYIDVILFAMVAVFLALRLRSVLGRRTGDEKPPPGMGPTPPGPMAPRTGRVIDITPGIRQNPALPVGPAGLGLSAIMQADPSFTPDGFLAGAKAAFAMILHGFVEGDEATLRGLLADAVFQPFSQAIRARNTAGEVCANALEEIEAATIIEAKLDRMVAEVTVRFVSRQLVATKDSGGAVIEGDLTHPIEHIDLWTFSRDMRSRSPNWLLAATRNPEE